MTDWQAPAKLNLSLQVRPQDEAGLHPLRSLVQTIEWCDLISVEEGDDDQLEIEGADLPEGGDNLVWKAVAALRRRSPPHLPPLWIKLVKQIPVAAGLGGGSADAAAILRAVAEMVRIDSSEVLVAAKEVGADVPYLLAGGLAWMEGHGDRITALANPPQGFGIAVVVPPFELSTAAVYREWDRLEGPEGPSVSERHLPPGLREFGPVRNDLTPAAISLLPELADWMAEVADLWNRPVAMTGSGPAVFGFFLDEEEAAAAVTWVTGGRGAIGTSPRTKGASRADR
jgi:4-diphosphocytidyl-2-C-methyl-D-erythritol kinase